MSGLETEFPDRIDAQNVDATTPESLRVVRELGFRSHGLVIRSTSGDALWKQPDHEVDMAAVRAAIRERLDGG